MNLISFLVVMVPFVAGALAGFLSSSRSRPILASLIMSALCGFAAALYWASSGDTGLVDLRGFWPVVFIAFTVPMSLSAILIIWFMRRLRDGVVSSRKKATGS